VLPPAVDFVIVRATASLPYIPQGSTQEASVTRHFHCGAAADAIIEGGGRGMLTIAVVTPLQRRRRREG